MNRNEDIHLLIGSLSKAEKKFFKLFSAYQSGEKNYIRLFDAIDAQKNYNEEKIKQKFEGETFITHLPSEKIYLQKMLLKALRSFHSESTAEMRAQSMNTDAEILYNKWLIPLAEKAGRKALTFAENSGRIMQVNAALRTLDSIYTYKDVSYTMFQEWKSLLQRRKSVQQSMLNITEIRILSTRLLYLSKRYGNRFPETALDQVRDMLKHPLLAGKMKPATGHETIERLHLLTYIWYHLGERGKQAETLLKSLNYYEGVLNKGITANMKNVISTLSNYIKCRIDLKQFKGLENYFAKYNSFKKHAPENTVDFLAGIELRDKLKFYTSSGNPDKATDLFQSTPKTVLGKITAEHLLHIRYYYSLAHFLRGNCKASLKVLNGVLSSEKEPSLDYFFTASRMLQLMCYYEQKDFELLHHRAISAKRTLDSKKQLFAFEKELLSFFVRTDGEWEKAGFYKLYASLTKILKGKKERMAIQELDVMGWVESKL